MRSLNTEQRMYYVLRIAAAMCFIGHGAFGIITKAVWCNYFALFGIGHNRAYQLMPVLGTVDILMGILLLVYPVRSIAIWLVAWGLITAALRPLSGEPLPELIERAGNFGAPLALLLLSGDSRISLGSWFKQIEPAPYIDEIILYRVTLCLRLIVFLLLIGHGWLNLVEKKGLIGQYTTLGFTNPVNTAHVIGLAEIVAASVVLIRPARPLLLIFLIWKVASELFYPHWEIFEWIERGGSYGCILALWLAVKPATEINAEHQPAM